MIAARDQMPGGRLEVRPTLGRPLWLGSLENPHSRQPQPEVGHPVSIFFGGS
jgi:hypothetical protein